MTAGKSLAAGNNYISVGPVVLYGLTGNTSNNACTVALHDCAATGDIAAGNKLHTYTLRAGQVDYNFNGLMFLKGLCVVVTLNSATADLLLEFN